MGCGAWRGGGGGSGRGSRNGCDAAALDLAVGGEAGKEVRRQAVDLLAHRPRAVQAVDLEDERGAKEVHRLGDFGVGGLGAARRRRRRRRLGFGDQVVHLAVVRADGCGVKREKSEKGADRGPREAPRAHTPPPLPPLHAPASSVSYVPTYEFLPRR